jgi:hypothetical protein
VIIHLSRDLIVLKAGVSYSFEAVSNTLKLQYPMAFTVDPDSGRATDILNKRSVVTPLHANHEYPLRSDDDAVLLTPPDRGIERLWLQSINHYNIGLQLLIVDTCLPSHSNICVRFNTGTRQFELDTNDGSGYAPRHDLLLRARKQYRFEAVGDTFGEFPFIISRDGDGERVTDPELVSGEPMLRADDDALFFTPPGDASVWFYFQTPDTSVGPSPIRIKNTCVASETHFCVMCSHENEHYDAVDEEGGVLFAINQHNDHKFMIDSGDGMKLQPTLVLTAGTTYTFELIGPFIEHPFTIVSDPQLKTVWVIGVTGKHPAIEDDQKIRFTPEHTGPSRLYYASMKNDADMSGMVIIKNACQPTEARICVTAVADVASSAYGREGFLTQTGEQLEPQFRGDLQLRAEQTYEFELAADMKRGHGFMLSTSSDLRDTDAFLWPKPLSWDDERQIFKPKSSFTAALYYLDVGSKDWGGQLHVANTCKSSATYLCVSFELNPGAVNETDGVYWVDAGQGRMQHPTLLLRSNVRYTFEMQGARVPAFALTSSTSGTATVVWTKDLYQNTNLVTDDDKFIFIPRMDDYESTQLLEYQSMVTRGAGGRVIICNSERGACPDQKTSLVGYTSKGNVTELLLNATAVGNGGEEGGFNVTVTTFPSDFTDTTEIKDYYEDPTEIPLPQKSPKPAKNQDKSVAKKSQEPPTDTNGAASTACVVFGTFVGFCATVAACVL